MQTRSRLLLAGLVATLALLSAVATSSASRLSVSQGTFRSVWTPFRISALEEIVQCNLTLEGSLHSTTINKVSSAAIGDATRAVIGGCTEGSMTVLAETLPWIVQYSSFEGSLPTMTGLSLLIINASFRADPPRLPACLARTTTTNPWRLIASRATETGVLTGLRWDETSSIPLSSGIGCGLFSGRFSGLGTYTRLGEAESVTLTLIGDPTLTPSPVEFGAFEPESLARRTATLSAAGALTVNSISVRAGNHFAITDPNRCAGTRLEAGGRCSFSVLFAAPRETGRTLEDTVTVESSLGAVSTIARAST